MASHGIPSLKKRLSRLLHHKGCDKVIAEHVAYVDDSLVELLCELYKYCSF